MQGVNQTIVQDMQILKHNVLSSVSKVECYVCGKGIEDGHSITREIGRSNRNIGRRAVIPAADDMGSLDAEMREQLA